ncbi:hypothetical protein QTP70_007432 [Hemibagrus guttatus]|uniref:Tc1-like transposase DDE domain-containing protein n=1 Tax=Hemibagrus guttatus TaxID=175788 RepID=A0AAE0V1H7_9TELE|nr:hypothetical protein QTP70_007432 [Hemibagrus guttatus]
MSEISRGSFKDEAPDWLSIPTGSEGNSCRGPAEEKNLSEKAEEADKEPEAVHTHGHVYQLHLNQHAGAWDSIARVNEEILLTMLDIYENFKMCVCEDSESKRLRTVKNIADLRQNLEETMSSLRQVTHISHRFFCLAVAAVDGVGLGPLAPVKGTLNASAYQDILDNFMLPTLWEQFGDDPFLFQHDCTPVTKARSIKTWMSEFGVEELDWPAQSPDLNPIEHLWDELEWRLRARPSRPTSVPDLTNVLLEERSKIPINTLLNLVESLPRS